MSPILGIWASAQQGQFLTAFDSIATVTVGSGGATSISFTSIPSTYKHLQLRAFIDSNASDGYMSLRFNGDTTSSNYRYHYLQGNGSSASAGSGASAAYFPSTAGTDGGVAIMDILDYQNTNKYKTIRILNGWDSNGSGIISFASNLWMSTNAINEITLTNTGMNPQQYSHFALYGVKG